MRRSRSSRLERRRADRRGRRAASSRALPPAPCAARSRASRVPPAATATSPEGPRTAARRCAARCSGALRSCSTSSRARATRSSCAAGSRSTSRAANCSWSSSRCSERRRRAVRALPAPASASSRPKACSTPRRKRPLPPYPRAIGVVTSLAGAALHDVATTLRAALAARPRRGLSERRCRAPTRRRRCARAIALAGARATRSTCCSSAAAAARSRTCGPSTTSASCARSARRRCRW